VREVSIYELLAPLLFIERSTKLDFNSACSLDNNAHFLQKPDNLRD